MPSYSIGIDWFTFYFGVVKFLHVGVQLSSFRKHFLVEEFLRTFDWLPCLLCFTHFQILYQNHPFTNQYLVCCSNDYTCPICSASASLCSDSRSTQEWFCEDDPNHPQDLPLTPIFHHRNLTNSSPSLTYLPEMTISFILLHPKTAQISSLTLKICEDRRASGFWELLHMMVHLYKWYFRASKLCI